MRLHTCVRPITALALVALCMAASGTPAPEVGPAVERVPRGAAPAPAALVVELPQPRRTTAAVVVSARPAPAGGAGVPANVLAAYRAAEGVLARSHPGCHLAWYHLAGIGVIESGHARGGQATPAGDTAPRILGPRLDGGPGIAAIPDTDDGRLDSDLVWDRAVGPMQFIPSTWAAYGVDADGDGDADPHNLTDAATASGAYLCSGGMDLADPSDLSAAIFRYNHSAEYVTAVMSWMRRYSGGATPVPPRGPGSAETPVLLVSGTRSTPRPVQTPAPVPKPAPAERPVAGKPVAEKPVEEAPVDEAPVEEAPVEEAPVEEAPGDEDQLTEEDLVNLPCDLLAEAVELLGEKVEELATCTPEEDEEKAAGTTGSEQEKAAGGAQGRTAGTTGGEQGKAAKSGSEREKAGTSGGEQK